MPVPVIPTLRAVGAAVSTGRVAQASYTVEIAWSAYQLGLFTIGFSQIGGTDVLGVSALDATFTGPYDNRSSVFLDGTVDRGRDNADGQMGAGTCVVRLRDRTGLLNPANVASPLFGQIEERLPPLRLRGITAATTWPVFYGFVKGIEWRPSPRGRGVAEIYAEDLLSLLGGDFAPKPVVTEAGATTTGAAIGKVLDGAGWTDPQARSLDAGDPIPSFSAEGDKTALDLIAGLLVAERGVFYIDAAGRAVYRSRHSRMKGSVAATIASEMKALTPGLDLRRIRNRATVKRTQNGYVAVAGNASSQSKLGIRDADTVDTGYLTSDADADRLAYFIVTQLSTPRPPMRNLKIDNRTATILGHCLARDLGDRVSVSEAAGDSSGEFLIEKINHQIGRRGRGHDTAWTLQRTLGYRPFIIGQSTIGSTLERIVY